MAYSRVQQRALTNAMLMGLPVKDLKNPDYSEDVMLDIIECLEIGVDPVFCKCGKFNKAQRREIIYGLDGAVDVNAYANPDFNADQMYEIRAGLEYGMDVSSYAKPELSPRQMAEIRESMVNVDVLDYDWFEGGVGVEELEKGLMTGLDVIWYSDCFFTPEQCWEIRVGLREGLDVSWYAYTDFSDSQMREVRHGLEAGIDVSLYAYVDYDDLLMCEIKRGLIQGFDMRSVLSEFTVINCENVRHAREGLTIDNHDRVLPMKLC